MESLRALNSKDKKKRQEWDEMTMQYLIAVHGHEMIVWQEETDEKIKKQSDEAEVEKEKEDEDWGDDSATCLGNRQDTRCTPGMSMTLADF
jgi:hypothetical protein